MIYTDIDLEDIEDTHEVVTHLGEHNGKIKLRHDVMFTGYLGETIFEKLFSATRVNDYNYDYLLSGKRIDVKTKASQDMPELWQEVSNYPHQKWQDTDYYAFMRVNYDFTRAWFLGIVSKEEFFDNAFLIKKGEKQPSGLIPKTDSYNMTLDKIWELSKHDLFGH